MSGEVDYVDHKQGQQVGTQEAQLDELHSFGHLLVLHPQQHHQQHAADIQNDQLSNIIHEIRQRLVEHQENYDSHGQE